MRTLHVADALRLGPDGSARPGSAVLVGGERVEAIGPADELLGAYPGVRVRRWAGVLGPALVHDGPLPAASTPRERVHALFRMGVSAVPAAWLTDPELRAVALRSRLAVPETGAPRVLTVGGRADLAVFGPDGVCRATVLAGRLVHRAT
ncbi:imidazolonepropionase-like domain-containing protein [Micromonospora sp. WMMA1923]|uniref:imidazolonepropionase-like domain-containing protein n=1 Tax=Micromonospora sp. WMMA1923 TaxID=3404125 RepID=UPI003B957744